MKVKSLTEGLIRNRYVGRTFISPNQKLRELEVKTKFNVLDQVVKDKIILIDDSIVRGTTTLGYRNDKESEARSS